MFNLEEIYQEYLKLPYKEKVDNALVSIGEISSTLERLGINEDDRISFYLSLTALFVAADKEISAKEVKLFNDVFGTSFDKEAFEELFRNGAKKEFVEGMNKIIDNFPEEAKFAACVYGLIFLSIDGNITPKEKAVFEMILE